MTDPRIFFAIIVRSTASLFSPRIVASILDDRLQSHSRSVTHSQDTVTCILNERPSDELIAKVLEGYEKNALVGYLSEVELHT